MKVHKFPSFKYKNLKNTFSNYKTLYNKVFAL